MNFRMNRFAYLLGLILASQCLPLRAQTGTCAVPIAGNALPDLIVDVNRLRGEIVINKESFSANSCAVAESCVPRGVHTLLRFTASTPNIGKGDLVIGDPNKCPNLFHESECHHHFHFEQYSDYRLWTEAGYAKWTAGRQIDAPTNSGTNADLLAKAVSNKELLTGRKQGFCMIDIAKYSSNASSTPKFNLCGSPGAPGNQGLQVGWTDVYVQALDCQYIPIDGLAVGFYILEVQVNPEHLLPESDYSNNSTAVRFQLTLKGKTPIVTVF